MHQDYLSLDSSYRAGLILLLMGVLSLTMACGDDFSSTTDPIIIIDEEPQECLEDCPVTCGDSICSSGESASSCPFDCNAFCGDAACTHTENAQTCAQDCPAVCGDGLCTHDETPQECIADCTPEFVTIIFQQALIGPTKSDGCQWDGVFCGAASDASLKEKISKVKTGNVYIDVILALYALGTFDALNKPDVTGTFSVLSTGQSTFFNKVQDSFQPVLSLVFTGVKYDGALRIQYLLEDSDLENNDPIAAGTLSRDDLEPALRSGQDTWITDQVRVSSNAQLIGLSVTVIPE